MSLLLAVHTYPGANQAIERHFPCWVKSGADEIMGILTQDGCQWPDGYNSVKLGRDSYIDGPVLPQRLLDTMKLMLLMPFDRFCIIEWDCLFFKPLPEFSGMSAFHAGNRMGNMLAEKFYHVPWCFDFDAGTAFVKEGEKAIREVQPGMHECSPDVFFGWVCERAGLPVSQPWEGFSRNSLDCAGDVELAREAYLSGATAIHGIKTRSNFDYILS